MSRINNPKPITVDYLVRISDVIDLPAGVNYSWRPVVLSSRPRYILIGFKDSDG